MHPYDECVERIKARNDTSEARAWLERHGRHYGVIHELSHEESLEVVDEAYRRGAVKVEVVGSLSDVATETSVDMVLITLPKDKADRQLLFELEEAIAHETGFDGSVDEGQKYILVRWT
jgi:predicted polyphosphate/ATP-dependent NAD kinase